MRGTFSGLRGKLAEFDPDAPHRVIDLMNEQRSVENLGGTMRLGAYLAKIAPGTLASHLRHRPNFRTAPASLRGQQRLSGSAGQGGTYAVGAFSRRKTRRNGRNSRSPVLRRLPVPSRVQEPPAQPASAVPRVRRRRARPQRQAELSERLGAALLPGKFALRFAKLHRQCAAFCLDQVQPLAVMSKSGDVPARISTSFPAVTCPGSVGGGYTVITWPLTKTLPGLSNSADRRGPA